jgi:hypothetical protein
MQETKFIVSLSKWRYLGHNTKENNDVEDIYKNLEKFRCETLYLTTKHGA